MCARSIFWILFFSANDHSNGNDANKNACLKWKVSEKNETNDLSLSPPLKMRVWVCQSGMEKFAWDEMLIS